MVWEDGGGDPASYPIWGFGYLTRTTDRIDLDRNAALFPADRSSLQLNT